jgi:ubiquitin-activating enzyme E1
VEQLKSTTAAQAVKQMNPFVNIKSYSNRVGPDTESIFNEGFYNSLSGVCNALDNVEARMYMDSQCIFYKKPLLESGTLGTKGNTQVIVPNLTESYASSRDPPEKTIPICTLHHFPNNIEHTIQWARDSFEGLFHNQAETVNTYLTNTSFMEQLQKQSGGVKLDTLNTLKKSLVDEKPLTFEHCVAYGRLKFEEFFNNNIQQLLYNFPLDMITSNGAPFWSGPKRAPKPLQFNPEDETHLEFVLSAANLRAHNYGIQGTRDVAVVKKALQHVRVPEFVPKKGIKINTDENATEKKEP